MNDLLEAGLRGADTVRRRVVAQPLPVLAAAGFSLGAVVVVTGGRIGPAPAAVPVTSWLGLLPPASYLVTGVGMGLAMLAAIGALLGLWLLAAHLTTGRAWTVREVAWLSGAWALPFAVGPPLLNTDLYQHVARGVLARNGLSPYHHPIDQVDARIAEAVDPVWRGTGSTAGPLTTLLEHVTLSVTGGSVLAAVIVFRLIAVAAYLAVAREAVAFGSRPASTLALLAPNPAVLIFVVSAGPVLGILCAVLLATLAATRRRRWVRAVALACIAAGIKPVALLAVGAVVLGHVVSRQRSLRGLIVVRDGVVAVVVLGLVLLAVPHPFGWIPNLPDAIHEHIALAPASLVSDVIGWVVPSASFDDLATGGRIAVAAGGVIVLAYQFATIRSRPLAHTLGYALLTAAILGPVVYPPFLLWGLVCLASSATGPVRDWVFALSAVACVLAPVGLGERGGLYATLVAFAAIALVLGRRLAGRRLSRPGQRLVPPLTSRTAGRTSAR